MMAVCPKCDHRFNPTRRLYPVEGFPDKAYRGPQCKKEVYRYARSLGKYRCRNSGKYGGYCHHHRKKKARR